MTDKESACQVLAVLAWGITTAYLVHYAEIPAFLREYASTKDFMALAGCIAAGAIVAYLAYRLLGWFATPSKKEIIEGESEE